MKQSQYDPTLKEHFTEEEARRWIRHLEKIIESYEKKEKYRKEKNALFTAKFAETKKRLARVITHLEFLQEKFPDIDFGVEAFKQKHNLEK